MDAEGDRSARGGADAGGGDAAAGVSLVRTDAGLALVGEGMSVTCDFSRLSARIRPGALSREPIVRAARQSGARGGGRPWAVDATAGLGEDAYLLAAAGFSVDLYERNPLVAALLADGLARAAEGADTAPVVARMRLHEGDGARALEAMAADGSRPDAVFLDPMYPARRKSAQVKKKPQLLQRLEAPSTPEEQSRLLRAALAAGPAKVVVKRPAKGPFLANVKPSYSLQSKAVRLDVYLPASMPAPPL